MGKKVTSGSGSNGLRFNSIAVDTSGNIYAVGSIYGSGTYNFGNNITITHTSTSNTRPVLVKYDNSGNALWVKEATRSGSNESTFNSIAIDTNGNIYVDGYITGDPHDFGNNVTTINTFVASKPVLVKYDNNGNAQWVKSMNNNGGWSGFNSLTIGNNGSIYAIGYICGGYPFDFGNGAIVNATCSSNSDNDPIFAKYDSNGNTRWVKNHAGMRGSSKFESVVIDSNGNIYTDGYIDETGTYNFGNDVTVTGTSSVRNPALVKYNVNGSALWAKSIISGFEGTDFYSLAIDNNGNIYTCGYLDGNGSYNFGNGVTITQPSLATYPVLVKYDNNGNAQWAKSLIGGINSEFNSVTTDSSGNIYVGGYIYYGGTTYKFGNGVTVVGGNSYGGYVLLVKYNSTGGAQWARSVNNKAAGVPGYGLSEFNSVAVDINKNIYAGGYIYAGNYSFGNNITLIGTGLYSFENILLVKYDNSGNALWAKSLIKTSDSSVFYSVAVDMDGNIYAAGYIHGNNIYDFGNGIKITGKISGNYSPVLVKYDNNGNAKWAKSVDGGSGFSRFNSVIVDKNGNIYVGGYVDGSYIYDFGNGVTVDGIMSDGGFSGHNPVLVKYDNNGNAQWVKSIVAGLKGAEFKSITIDKDENIYASGYVIGTNNFDFSKNITVAGTSSLYNPLLIKYKKNTPPVLAKPLADKNTTTNTILNYLIPDGTFIDAEGDPIMYKITGANNTSLPAWLKTTVGPVFKCSYDIKGSARALDVANNKLLVGLQNSLPQLFDASNPTSLTPIKADEFTESIIIGDGTTNINTELQSANNKKIALLQSTYTIGDTSKLETQNSAALISNASLTKHQIDFFNNTFGQLIVNYPKNNPTVMINDNKTTLSSSNLGILITDKQSGTPVTSLCQTTYPNNIYDLALHNNGKTVYAALGNAIQILDFTSYKTTGIAGVPQDVDTYNLELIACDYNNACSNPVSFNINVNP